MSNIPSTQISIKTFSIASLIFFGAAVLLLVFFIGEELEKISEQNIVRTQNQVIAVSTRSVIWDAEHKLKQLAGDVQSNPAFRVLLNRMLNSPEEANYRRSMVAQLNEQFYQRWVTAEILDLEKIRIYDINFKLIAETNVKTNISKFADHLLERAKVRTGAQRLQQISDVWNDGGTPLLSMLAASGGLRPQGYVEIIVGLTHELQKIELTTGQLTQLEGINGNLLYETSSLKDMTDDFLPVSYEIRDLKGNTVMWIRQLISEDFLHENFNNAFNVFLIAVACLVGAGILVFALLNHRFLLKPIKVVQYRMAELAKGNIDVDTSPNFHLSELSAIDHSMTDVIAFFRKRLLLIGDTGKDLSESAKVVSEKAQSAVENLRTQQDDVAQVTDATRELMSMTKQITEQTLSTSQCSQRANEKALEGDSLVRAANSSTDKLVTEVNQSAKQILNLQDEVKNATKILDEIGDISDQTNLLALNAAIEAERAGEQGRGFAVVADEVRSLAGRSFESTENVRSVLQNLTVGIDKIVAVMKKSQEQANDTMDNVTELGKGLHDISEMVSQIHSMNTSIASSAETQTDVTSAISENLNNIMDMANTVSDSALKVTSSSGDLSQMAIQLESLVSAFKVAGLKKSSDQDEVELF